MALRIVPSAPNPSITLTTPGAPSAPGIHDTLRSNLSLTAPPPKANPTALQLASSHPLEARLTQWRTQQDSLKMTLLRQTYGIAEPVKRMMELRIVAQGEWRPSCLGMGMGGGVHSDILSGRDTEIGWEDVFSGWEGRDEVGFHEEMERGWGMGW